ncbi:MAG: GTPase [Nanoarchaeota archaeon]
MPVNAGYEYVNAEKKYFQAATLDEKILALQEMIKAAPKHKSSEHLVAELKNRLRRFIEKKEKAKTIGKTTQKTIRKEGFQCVFLGLTNSGKSSLLAKLTNAKPRVSSFQFTTTQPEIGTLDFEGFKAQIVDLPAIGSEYFDLGIVNTADCVIIAIEQIEDLGKIYPYLSKIYGKIIIAINKADLLSQEEIRKLNEKVKSKKLNAVICSCISDFGIEELKKKIITLMPLIRVYLKEPGKPVSNIPMILKINSTVRDAAESILKGFSIRVKETKVTGPSSKFPNQKVGLSHILKDLDTIEFHTN